MNFQITNFFIKQIINVVKNAGIKILEVYDSDFDIQIKNDQSPVTLADQKANVIIERGLNNIDSSIPILSEEGKEIEYEIRRKWNCFWLVDPLDGTKEFIKKNGEFTVNIALINNRSPVFGIVYAPVADIYFWGGHGYGAWKKKGNEIPEKIKVNSKIDKLTKLAASRSHVSEKMNKFLLQFEDYELYPMGSSFKICLVSDGTVDLYPRLGPTMEWDTAASHAIIKAAGGELIQIDNKLPLGYNKIELLNPEFIAGNIEIINNIKF